MQCLCGNMPLETSIVLKALHYINWGCQIVITCRFSPKVCRTRKWTTAVRPDEWSCKQSTCKVETDQHSTWTNTQWPRILHGFKSQWPSPVFHLRFPGLEESSNSTIHMVHCDRSTRDTSSWWKEASSGTYNQASVINHQIDTVPEHSIVLLMQLYIRVCELPTHCTSHPLSSISY